MTGRTARDRRRVRGDEGFSLIEMMVVLVALGVLLAITVPIVSTVLQTTSRIRNTYTNLNSQLSVSTTLQRLLRVAVAPAPSFRGSTAVTPPSTPFLAGAVTPTSLTFYANTGTALGPAEVEASCTQTSTDKTLCAPTAIFTLTLTKAETGTCPVTGITTGTCIWPAASKHTLLVISHVTNGDSTTAEPLFTYSYGSKTVCSAGTPSGCSGSDAVTFAGGTHCHKSSTGTADHPFTTCPAGEIDEVAYDLSFNAKVTKTKATQTTPRDGGLQTQTVSGTFVMSSTSMLYSPVAG